MKTFIIDRIGDKNVKLNVSGIAELDINAALVAGFTRKLYAHCAHVLTDGKNWKDEQNVEYFVYVNNRKRTITSRRF